MIKKIILGISILFSTSILAQEGTASPYSYYGLGDVKFKGTSESRAMGSLGVLADSIHINLQNPASYSSLSFTTLSVGGSNTGTSFKTPSQEEKAKRTTLDYLAVGLPFGKLGVVFGLVPYSVVGYKVQKDVITQDLAYRTQTYNGDGGVNRVFFGGAYKITPKLSFGADFQYNFGSIERTSVVFSTQNPSIVLGARAKNESTYSGVSFNTGLFYQTKLKNGLEWHSSFTYAPKSNLTAKNTRNVATVSYNLAGTEFVSEDQDVDVADSKFGIAQKVSFGTAFGKTKKWFVGTEVVLEGKKDIGAQPATSTATSESASRFSIGGYYIPKYNSFRNYFQRIVYRGGLKYEKTGLVVSGKSINDTAATLGFGFPVGSNISNINLGLEYGKRGTSQPGLIQENYFSVSIGLSFSDRWFVKSKYD